MSVKEIFEKACEMGLDKECNDGKILSHSLGSQLGEHNIKEEYKQFYVARKEGKTFFYWLKSREREFPPQETSNAEDDEQASVQAQPKNKKTLLMKVIYTDCL